MLLTRRRQRWTGSATEVETHAVPEQLPDSERSSCHRDFAALAIQRHSTPVTVDKQRLASSPSAALRSPRVDVGAAPEQGVGPRSSSSRQPSSRQPLSTDVVMVAQRRVRACHEPRRCWGEEIGWDVKVGTMRAQTVVSCRGLGCRQVHGSPSHAPRSNCRGFGCELDLCLYTGSDGGCGLRGQPSGCRGTGGATGGSNRVGPGLNFTHVCRQPVRSEPRASPSGRCSGTCQFHQNHDHQGLTALLHRRVPLPAGRAGESQASKFLDFERAFE